MRTPREKVDTSRRRCCGESASLELRRSFQRQQVLTLPLFGRHGRDGRAIRPHLRRGSGGGARECVCVRVCAQKSLQLQVLT